MDSGYKMGMVIQFHMNSCHGVREKVYIPNLESNSWMTRVKRLEDHYHKSLIIHSQNTYALKNFKCCPYPTIHVSNTSAQKNFKDHNIHFSNMLHVLEHILCNLSNGWIKIFCGLFNIWSRNLTWFRFHESKCNVFCGISCEIEEPRSKKFCWI